MMRVLRQYMLHGDRLESYSLVRVLDDVYRAMRFKQNRLSLASEYNCGRLISSKFYSTEIHSVLFSP